MGWTEALIPEMMRFLLENIFEGFILVDKEGYLEFRGGGKC